MSSSSSEARPRKRKESRETSAERMIIMPMTVWRRYGNRYAFAAFRSFEQPQAAANRLCPEDFGAGCVAHFQRGARYHETLLHRRVILGEIAHQAAIFERQAVGIFEV